jgi:hypothetical protein
VRTAWKNSGVRVSLEQGSIVFPRFFFVTFFVAMTKKVSEAI